MTLLSALFFFALAISPLVFLHELGHYLAGRFCGVRAEAFSIGFGRSIARWTDRRGTAWQVGWLPLGGYVRFAGDANAASANVGSARTQGGDTLDSKPVWQRAFIVSAGPLVNFLFAIVMLTGLFAVVGEPRIAPVVGGFAANSAARNAGMAVGDRIVAINGEAIDRFEDIAMIVQVRAGLPTPVTVERGGRQIELQATPLREAVADLSGAKVPLGRLGVAPMRVEHVRLSATELPSAALRFTGDSLQMMARALGQIVTGQRSLQELGGPVKVAAVSNKMAGFGLIAFLFFMVAVSINLGFINLLPIPMLDGGHLAFLAAEALRGRPVGVRAQELAYRSGLALLLGFTLFVTVNDLGGLGLW